MDCLFDRMTFSIVIRRLSIKINNLKLMDWEELQRDIENTIGSRLDSLNCGLEVQKLRLTDTINKIQGFWRVT